MTFGYYKDQTKSNYDMDFVINKDLNITSNRRMKGYTFATATCQVKSSTPADFADQYFRMGAPHVPSFALEVATIWFIFSDDAADGATGTVISGPKTVIQLNGLSSIGDIAAQVLAGITNTSNGLGDYITGVLSTTAATNDTVTLTQKFPGEHGNRSITQILGGSPNVNVFSINGGIIASYFTGGSPSPLQAPFSVGVKGPMNLRGRTTAYKVER